MSGYRRVTQPLSCLHVYTYGYRWSVDYTRLERVRTGFAIYDFDTGERIPF